VTAEQKKPSRRRRMQPLTTQPAQPIKPKRRTPRKVAEINQSRESGVRTAGTTQTNPSASVAPPTVPDPVQSQSKTKRRRRRRIESVQTAGETQTSGADVSPQASYNLPATSEVPSHGLWGIPEVPPDDTSVEVTPDVVEDLEDELGLCWQIYVAIDRQGKSKASVLRECQQEYEGFTAAHLEYALRRNREIYRKEPGWMGRQPDMLDLRNNSGWLY